MGKGEGKGSDTRAQILEAALRTVNQVGLQGLTIGGLAKEVGMSKSGLFAHFNSKENLQLMVLKRAAQQFTEAVLIPSFKEPRGEPRVRAILKNWLSYLDEDSEDRPSPGNVLISVSVEVNEQPEVVRQYIQQIQKRLIADLDKAAQIAVKEGHFHKDSDTDLFAWSMYSFVLGYFHSKRMLEDPRAEEHVRRSFEGLIRFSKMESGATLAPVSTGAALSEGIGR